MKMIDISAKRVTEREAVVEGRIILKPAVITAIKHNRMPKGNVLEAAKVAGILAVKRTPEIIPLCHPVYVEKVDISFSLKDKEIKIRAVVKARAKTGVEMEAFTAAAVCGLTIYDMCKALDRGAVISDIKLIKKSGGKSGVYERKCLDK